MYALSLLSVSNARKISLVGVDGYESQSLKQKELNEAFVQFQENNPDISLVAITPTSLPINTAFIYD